MKNDKKDLMNSYIFWFVVIMAQVAGTVQDACNKGKIYNENHPGAERIDAQGNLSKYLIARKDYFESLAIQGVKGDDRS